MAARYNGARLVIAATVAAGVIVGSTYFAAGAPSGSLSDTTDSSSSTSIQAQKHPQQSTAARRSRGS